MTRKACPTCGHPMHRQSKQCRACYESRPGNYQTAACAKCAKEFRVHGSQIAIGHGRYCSRACARSGSPTRKRAPVVCPCAGCGAQVERYPADMRKSKGKAAYCSSKCWYEHNRGERHVLWAGGQHERMNAEAAQWRKAVLTRDKYYCRICRARRPLEVHHILPFSTHKERRWDVANGITLCEPCHRSFRHREIEYAELLQFVASVPLMVWRIDERRTRGTLGLELA